jgi:hypothetical protein
VPLFLLRAGRRRLSRVGWLVSATAGGSVALLVSLVVLASGPAPGEPVPAAASGSAAPSTSASTEPTASSQPVTTTAPVSTSAPSPAKPPVGTSLGGCPNLPAGNVWHADVSGLPAHTRSARYVAAIGAGGAVKADFGAGLWEGGPIGIPITYAAGAAKVAVRFEYADESDPGPYPVPRDAAIEGGPNADGDRHVLVVDTAACRLYELFAALPKGDGSWDAGSGAVYDLRSDKLRPAGWTSADAAGLPVAPGLVRYEEVAAGRIDHAIRVTVPKSQRAYLWPARHAASDSTDANLPPMGLRLRLKPTVDISGLPPQAKVIAQAMKTHGMLVADNGSPWFISGAPDERWDNNALRAIGRLHGSDFEAVDTATLIADPNSGKVR